MGQLAARFKTQGIFVSVESWDPFNFGSGIIETAVLRSQLIAENLWNHNIATPIKSLFRNYQQLPESLELDDPRVAEDTSLVISRDTDDYLRVVETRIKEKKENEVLSQLKPVPAIKSRPILDRFRDAVQPKSIPVVFAASGRSGSSGRPQVASSTGAGGSTQLQTSQTQHASLGPVTGQSSQNSQPQVATGNSPNVTIPQSNDFILLCFRVKTYLQRRHDLRLTGITRDRELFEGLREAYAANFRWARRMLSLKSVQKINFVKVGTSSQSLSPLTC